MSSRPRAAVHRPWLVSLIALALTASLLAPAVAQPSSDEVRRDIGSAEERLHELENRFGGVVDAYNEVAEELETVELALAGTEEELARLVQRSDELRSAVEDHVVRLHKLGPALEFSTIMVTGSPTETGDRMAALRRILDGQWADVEEYEAMRVSVAATEQRLDEQRAQVAERVAELESRRDEVEGFIEEQQDEIEELEATLQAALTREEEERRRAEERRRQQAAERARQERLQQESQDQAAADDSGASGAAAASAAPAPRANAQVAVDAALSKLGKPYQWGATGPNSFDCSGLMVWAWAQAGVSLPRTSAGQFSGLRSISRSELQPGDLVFSGSPTVHHVGMYIGNGQIVHSPHSGTTVSIRSMERGDLRGFGRPG